MRIGAHVRSGGGVFNAIDHALGMGAETIQIFSGSPQAWRRKNYTTAEVEKFKERTAETGIAPSFIHGLYLVNLASQNPDVLAKSYDALSAELQAANLIGAKGVIFHLGSHMGSGYEARFNQVVEYVGKVLEAAPGDAWLILENNAGQGGGIGSNFAELGKIVRESRSDRVRVCMDTQHAFASGYDVKTRPGLDKAMEEFDREVGLDRLVAVHANDSKSQLGGGLDRHENIGDGEIGRDGFANIISHPAFAEIPFLLEVPGYDDHGPDKQNVDTLKAIRAQVGVSA
jgi:deoxyribonuclease IV